ncbi:MAG: DUF1134 domain-containing protein [Allosphingosinicella sp.]
MGRPLFVKLFAVAAAAFMAASAPAQVSTIDPNAAAQRAPAPAQPVQSWDTEYQPVDSGTQDPASGGEPATPSAEAAAAPAASARASASAGSTVPRGDVFSAAEGVFGKGAEGLADLIEDLLRDQGEPSAYITGREAGGAFIAGVRYGSGTLHHQIEGDRPVFWTGPSVGFDFGADANKVFVLVYNLNDSQRLFRRYPAAEGNAYVVGGFTASYMRRGDTVLIPVRLGVGARLGINAGYMRFSQKNRWLPF